MALRAPPMAAQARALSPSTYMETLRASSSCERLKSPPKLKVVCWTAENPSACHSGFSVQPGHSSRCHAPTAPVSWQNGAASRSVACHWRQRHGGAGVGTDLTRQQQVLPRPPLLASNSMDQLQRQSSSGLHGVPSAGVLSGRTLSGGLPAAASPHQLTASAGADAFPARQLRQLRRQAGRQQPGRSASGQWRVWQRIRRPARQPGCGGADGDGLGGFPRGRLCCGTAPPLPVLRRSPAPPPLAPLPPLQPPPAAAHMHPTPCFPVKHQFVSRELLGWQPPHPTFFSIAETGGTLYVGNIGSRLMS